MTDALLPCPFCGAEAQIMEGHGGFSGRVQVECSECRVGTFYYEEAVAVRTWNRRAANAEQTVTLKPYEVTIGNGFFAGLKYTIDPALPPDTVEMRGANRVRLNTKTGEITEFAAALPQQEKEAALPAPYDYQRTMDAIGAAVEIVGNNALSISAKTFWKLYGAAPVAQQNDAELKFNATRLRNVARLVGLENAIPEDDETLDGARGSVLGMIAGKMRNDAQAVAPIPQQEPKPLSPDVLEAPETFDQLCRQHDIEGTAMARLAEVFFHAGAASMGTTNNGCNHEWVDARNEVIKSGELCVKCHAVRAATLVSPDDAEAAQLQTLLTDNFRQHRPKYPAGLYAWAYAALNAAPQEQPKPDVLDRVAKAMALHSGWDKWDTATTVCDTPSGNEPDEERQYWRDLALVAMSLQSTKEADNG